MLAFSPELSGLESLHSHRSTLESFGKKVDEKMKNLRAAELLFAAKKADWDATGELASELRANSDRVLILTEGLCERLFRAVQACCSPPVLNSDFELQMISSSLQSDTLKSVAESLEGQKVSLVLLFQNLPSERMVWAFRILLASLSKGRHPDEVKRRVVVSTGQPASAWERWSQGSSYRTLSFPNRCAGRYLFFSEPTAFLLNLLGHNAWSYVEGGRSFFRQYDKLMELEDPILAYAALREVQLAEHCRETLVLPDETYAELGFWWRAITEDSRKLFSEESNDGLIWLGGVMKETASTNRFHWVTEIAIDSNPELKTDGEPTEEGDAPPLACPELENWNILESLYRRKTDEEREGPGYAQPSVRIGLRRRDPLCIGGLFCFLECMVAASHRLAETSDEFSLMTPRAISTTGARA